MQTTRRKPIVWSITLREMVIKGGDSGSDKLVSQMYTGQKAKKIEMEYSQE